MASAVRERIIKSLRTCLLGRDPVTFGVCPIPEQNLGLFYGKGDAARQLYLHTASDAELEHLARACTAATFGINQQDVYDETYRKAGKMDVEEFASKFDLERSGILTRIKNDLLDEDRIKSDRHLECELYKLNFYATGGFFKAHKDTPRSANMFGSLVIVFPTKHTGGELKLRHGGKKWTFDSAKELAAVTEPSIGYIAFFSDVEHEVAVVQSGYRVTLTYNLYFRESHAPSESLINLDVNRENTFKTGLEQLLADPAFLPKGGRIGFGLQHEYPVSAETKLSTLMHCLKGSDALVKKVCEQLSLPIQPKMLTHADDYDTYDEEDGIIGLREISDESEDAVEDNGQGESVKDNPYYLEVLTDHVVDLSDWPFSVENTGRELRNAEGALILPLRPSGRHRQRYDFGKDKKVRYSVNIRWITEPTLYNEVKTPYIAYGNEHSLNYLYGTVCFVAKIGPPGKRIKDQHSGGA
ncbi:uncharacterized protein LOC129585581 [Paramacrobiotus metropolitanus]|uniref:uncharacterized protein LOC129585581 n=1 Tax=Paramacrobiotus metropolitanus TaxID=2943436 RepID=UPI00244650F6|nr:uncharacterized protein LOC129585581 [Paramacrobiotus metropolitanus]